MRSSSIAPRVSGSTRSRWVASARNSCAVVSASPSAWWGRWTGSRNARASSESPAGRPAGAEVPGPALKLSGERGGVHDRVPQLQRAPPQRRREEAALDRGDVGDHHPPRERRQQLVQLVVEGRSVLQIGGPQAVDADAVAVGHPRRAHEAVAAVGEADPAALDRDGRERDDLVARGVEAGRLEVEGGETDLAPSHRGIRHQRLDVCPGGRRGRPGRGQLITGQRRPPPSFLCTAVTSRNPSRR